MPSFLTRLLSARNFLLTMREIRYALNPGRKILRHTDVVSDAHHLPFSDDVFDRIFAFNVPAHLRDPKAGHRRNLGAP